MLDLPGGGRLLCAEHGARVIAVDVPGLGENPFFTATGGDGKLTGGDRLWLAPEVAWFWPSVEEARRDPKGTAAVPAGIDPGVYRTKKGDSLGLLLTGESGPLIDTRSGRTIRVSIERTFWAVEPIEGLPEGVSTSSFGMRNTLGRSQISDGNVVGGWDILMVPPTGTLICPTRGDIGDTGGPTSYYDPFGPRHVHTQPGRVRFLIDGKRRVKMGLPAEVTTGRMGYYRPLGDGRASLILRFFAPLPGEPYCDLPRDAPHGPDDPRLGGDCLQAYNDDGSAFGGSVGSDVTFGEIEYHDPCLVGGQPPRQRSGTCVTHILVGPDAHVRAAGERLLGVAVEAIG